MGTRAVREQQFGISDLWRVPIEWISTLTARFAGWLNQERWTNFLLITALLIANLAILGFLLQGQDNRAIAFTVLVLAAALAFLVPEVSIVFFILSGTGLIVNIAYYAIERGTGERVLSLFFFGVVSVRAIYEYLRLPKSQRPRLMTPLVIATVLFWVYYMFHVAYIYLFQYYRVPVDSKEAVLGIYQPGIFRHFDNHMLWIGIVPLLVLLRDIRRAMRVMLIFGIVMFISTLTIMWEYFSPLPPFFKVLFQLRAAGETGEGYRIREPAALYFSMVGFFFALYMIGYLRGWRNVLAVLFALAAAFAVLITKNRILWAGIVAFIPIVLLWKPPHAFLRQFVTWLFVALVGLALMLHPRIKEAVTQVTTEASERWSRNYAFGGDPRLDPSYQTRVREREAWEFTRQNQPLYQKIFGAGLEAGYGRYVSLYDTGLQNPRFRYIYIEKVHMHFAWLARLYRIGWVGVALLVTLLAVVFWRAAQAFLCTPVPYIRAVVIGVMGATVGALFFDALHELLHRSYATPVALMWSVFELVFHWKRTGQLDTFAGQEDLSPAPGTNGAA